MDGDPVKRVIIVGASGFGRELLAWCRDAGYDSNEWRIEGFIDDNRQALRGHEQSRYPWLGTIAEHQPAPDEWFACAISLPWKKRECIERLRERGARFLQVIHPSAVLGPDIELGEGCVICPRAILTTNIRLGAFVTVNCSSTIGHDARLGAWTSLNGHCDVTGRVVLGEGVLMGSHASVIPGIQVGDWAVIGAGSVACARVPAGTTVFGVPARVLWRSEQRG